MPVRVKVREKLLRTIALANSGYEAETPQILVPVEAARRLGLWPPRDAIETTYDTAGGPLRVWVYPGAAEVVVDVSDVEPPKTVADVVVSPVADEVLLSDALISELQIVIEDAKRGLWRFRWEPPSRLRTSSPPEYWR